jgi:hypothetical protein
MKQFLKSKFSLFVVPVLFIAIALFAKVYVLSDHKNAVEHQKEVKHPGYESSPEQFIIYPSPAKAWELTHLTPGGRTMDAIAVVLFWVAIALLVLGFLDITPLKPEQSLLAVFIVLCMWGGFKYGAYSSAIGNTQVILSPIDYQKANSTPHGLDELFNGKKPL